MLANREQPAEGLPHCQEAVRLQPDLPAAHNNLGNVLLALQRWEEARAAYTEAIRLEPGLAIAYANLGLTLQREGKVGTALPYFRRASSWPLRTPVSTSSWRPHTSWTKTGPRPSFVVSTASGSSPRTPTRTATSAGPAGPTSSRYQAEAAFRRALELQPDHLDAWLNLGLPPGRTGQDGRCGSLLSPGRGTTSSFAPAVGPPGRPGPRSVARRGPAPLPPVYARGPVAPHELPVCPGPSSRRPRRPRRGHRLSGAC